MNVAAVSSVASNFASQPVARPQAVAASVHAGSTSATSAAATQKSNAIQTANFGPATVVSLSAQAQSLLSSQSTVQTTNTPANSNAASTVQQGTINTASLALTYQSTAEQVWVQVLSSMGLSQAQLAALPLSQRSADEAKAEVLAQAQMSGQVQTPAGVSDTAEAEAISSAVQAVAGA